MIYDIVKDITYQTELITVRDETYNFLSEEY
jgi:hypothetical protein